MSVEAFLSTDPRLEDYWRGIVLFGRNVASYKFALAKTLLDLKPESGQLLKLSELAPSFAGNIASHLKLADKQITSASSQFLDVCRRFNKGEIDQDQLITETVKRGFNNVIDAFHVVNQGAIPKRFFVDERKTHEGIRITDEFSSLLMTPGANTLNDEVESRWRLVETAWEHPRAWHRCDCVALVRTISSLGTLQCLYFANSGSTIEPGRGNQSWRVTVA